MFEYQRWNRFFAQTANGIEELGAQELKELKATNIKPVYRGIYFEADKHTLYRINYMARIITRVIAPLISFQCHSAKYLYKTAKNINWDNILNLRQTFAISAHTSNSNITHSRYASLCLKDAIVDSFREKYNTRPSIDTIQPDIRLNLHINNNKATISIDTSGGSLHRRGYITNRVDAPMQENVAAAVIRLSKWDGTRPFHDIMCGSGTLICEALMSYTRTPPGFLRKNFGFQRLPDFDNNIWRDVKKEADASIREVPKGLINGGDISKQAVKTAKDNLSALPYGQNINLQAIDFREIPSLENSVIVLNPPYGIRTGKKKDMEILYKELGDFLKQRCKGSEAYIYCGKRELISKIGLKTSFKFPLANGPLDGRLIKLELY